MKLGPLAPDEHHEWAALYFAGALTPEEAASFEQHLNDGCEICLALVRELETVAAQLADAVAEDPPAPLRSSILDRIRKEVAPEANPVSPGVLLERAGLLISRSGEIPWIPAPLPGVKVKRLFVDSARNYSTSLVSLDAGAVYPEHKHNDVEEFYLLQGDLSGEGIQMKTGDYCRSEAGTIHSLAKSEAGALLLVWSSQSDQLL